jgi:hypothetical protein
MAALDATKLRRRWYQFSLRTMFVVMTLACVGVGLATWIQKSREWIRQRNRALDLNQIREREDGWFPIASGPKITAPGLLWLFGEIGTSEVVVFGDAQHMDEIRSLFPEAVVTYLPKRRPEPVVPAAVSIPTLPIAGEGERYSTPPAIAIPTP